MSLAVWSFVLILDPFNIIYVGLYTVYFFYLEMDNMNTYYTFMYDEVISRVILHETHNNIYLLEYIGAPPSIFYRSEESCRFGLA